MMGRVEFEPQNSYQRLEPLEAKPIENRFLKFCAFAMSGAGATSFFLYYMPSILCADDPYCGKPLSDLVSKSFAMAILLFCGALDFMLFNIFFGYESIFKLSEVLNKSQRIIEKIIITMTLVLVAALENSIPLAISIASKAPIYATIFTWIGAFPSMFYAMLILVERDFPYLKNQLATQFKAWQLNRHKENWTAAEALLIEKIHQHNLFKRRIKHKWLDALKNIDTLELAPKNDEFLGMLWVDKTPISDESRVVKGARMGSRAVGCSLSFHMIGTLYLQFFRVTKATWFQESDTEPALLTGLLGALLAFLILKVNISACDAVFDGLHNLAQRKPVDWLTMHCHPIKTALVSFIALLIAAFSHSTFITTFNRIYDGSNKDMLRAGVWLAIDIYHFIGIMKLFNLWEKYHPQNVKEASFYRLMNEVDRLERLPLSEFSKISEEALQPLEELIELGEFVGVAANPQDSKKPEVAGPPPSTSSTNSFPFMGSLMQLGASIWARVSRPHMQQSVDEMTRLRTSL